MPHCCQATFHNLCGMQGVLYGQKELVTAFFSWNSVQMVIAWYFFIDVVVDVKIK